MFFEKFGPDYEADAGDDDALVGDGGDGLPGDVTVDHGFGDCRDGEEQGDGPGHLPDDCADGVDVLDENAGIDLAIAEEEGGDDHHQVAEEGLGGECLGGAAHGEDDEAGDGDCEAEDAHGGEAILAVGAAPEVAGEVGEDGVGVEDDDAVGGGGHGAGRVEQSDLGGEENTEEEERAPFGRSRAKGDAAGERPAGDNEDADGHAPEGAPERGDAIDTDADGHKVAAPEDGDEDGEEEGSRADGFADRGGGRGQANIVSALRPATQSD